MSFCFWNITWFFSKNKDKLAFHSYCILNICAPPKFICGNPNAQGDGAGGGALEDRAFEKWLAHEGGVLMNGISALKKHTQRLPALPPHEDTERSNCLASGGGSQPEVEHAGTLILNSNHQICERDIFVVYNNAALLHTPDRLRSSWIFCQ